MNGRSTKGEAWEGLSTGASVPRTWGCHPPGVDVLSPRTLSCWGILCLLRVSVIHH